MRKYALTKLEAGDYVCPSNDGEMLWRFCRYQDGRVCGLDVDYELRTFWSTMRAPMAAAQRSLDRDEDIQWNGWEYMLASRADALRSVFG